MLLRSHIIRLIALLAILLQVALPVAQAHAAANGTPLSALICNPSGQKLSPAAQAAMTDLLDVLGPTDSPDSLPDCDRCVMPGIAIIGLSTLAEDMPRFARSAHHHPRSTELRINPVRGPPCGTRAPPSFV